MNEFYRNLYETLEKGIEECEKKHTDFRKHVECCFHVCESTAQLVDRQLSATAFQSAEEEIMFFRHIRPKFTSLVEFYSIVYRAELFLPETQNEKKEFWKNELLRAESFLELNREFHDYVKTGETSKDDEYFIRTGSGGTPFSDLLGQITARELYVELIRKKLAQTDY